MLQRVSELRSELPLPHADPLLKGEVELAREKLWTLYRAAYYGYLGDVERWEATLRRIVPELRENPYFRWFVTEAR